MHWVRQVLHEQRDGPLACQCRRYAAADERHPAAVRAAHKAQHVVRVSAAQSGVCVCEVEQTDACAHVQHSMCSTG